MSQFVTEMNVLLTDRTWWNANRRADAERRFSKPIMAAFYDEIQAGREYPESLREELIPLPTVKDGYSRALFVGTTGAGKTSLLRQLIGSDPDRDRFPSTAPAKTTIADIEIIQIDGTYRAAVTFFTEFQTQANVEECVIDACLAVREQAPVNKVADRLLNHRDQKFRLSYILGGWHKANDQEAADDEFSFDEEPETTNDGLEDGDLTASERVENREVLEGILSRINKLAAKTKHRLLDELDMDPGKSMSADREALEELIEENFEAYLTEDEGFHELVQDVLDRIRERFDLIEEGTLERYHSKLNALSNLGDVVGTREVRNIEHGIDDRCFMLGGVDQNLTRLPERASDYMRGELTRLVKFCENAILPPPLLEACPIYDPTGISFAVQEAV